MSPTFKRPLRALSLFAAVLAIGPSFVFAQTNPAAQPLPFSLTSQSGSTLPAGVALHRFGTTSAAIPTTRTVLPGNADLPYNSTSNSGGWRDEAANGIGILASGSNAAGALVVAINTTGLNTVQVSWRCGTILQQSARDNSVALQYRVGTSGDFTNVGSGTTYTSAGQTAGTFSGVLSETLPAGAENQPVVQVRWIYWESAGTSGSRDRIAVDDISILAQTASMTDPAVTGNAASATPGTAVLLAAVVTPGTNPASTGLVVTADLSALGGSSSQVLADSGGNTFTYTLAVPGGQAYGSYVLPLTVSDVQGRSGAGSLTLNVAGNWTLFHVNDVHSRLQPHDYDVPAIDDVPEFKTVGGAAYMAAKLISLKQAQPDSLVLDAGDVSEGGVLGDLRGNGGFIDFYKKLDERLESLGGRGVDAVVVGNHDVRFPEMLINMKNNGSFPFVSMNIIDLATGQPYFQEHVTVTINGVKIGVLGYTTDTSSYLGPDTEDMVRVAKCGWDDPGAEIKIRDKVAALRAAPNNCDVVVLLVHVGHSRVFSDDQSDDEYQLVKDDGVVKPPEVVIGGHWHTMTDTVWQPAITNYKTIVAEAASYMQHIGEIGLSPTGAYLSSQKHLVDNATIVPDAQIQTVVDNLIAEYNAGSPAYGLEQVIGYSATDLRLNKNKWWTHNEYPWAGDNAAGAWVADSMQWWVDSQPSYQCDLALQSGGGVRRDNAAGPITYREIYETYPWRDDNMILMEVKGQEIWNFIQNDFVGTSISQGWKVYANDGIIWKIEKNGVPIDLNGTYSVAISTYMYDHANDKVGGAWSDTTPTTIPYSIRQTIIDYTAQFTEANPMVVPGGRYELDTTHAGRFEAVVTMVDDNEDQPYFESVFVRLLSATPDTVARRGGYASADLVNADGSINTAHQFSESMLYRSYLGFKNGLLQPGDKILISVEGGFHAGNPQLVDQEGIVADGVEFVHLGSDLAAAAPSYHGTIGTFWDEHHENHFVKFQGEKTGANKIKDRQGFEISVYQPGGYNLYTLPGNVGDQLELTGVQTFRYSDRRFRCASATIVHTAGSVDYTPYSAVGAISPTTQYGPGGSLLLVAAASDATEQTFSNLLATEDATIADGSPNTVTNTANLYLQSATTAVNSFGNERILAKFDLSVLPAGANVTSATLRLWCWSQTATENGLGAAHAMTSDTWSETTATWNNSASLLGSQLATATLYPTNDQWYEWDVTGFVQSQDAGTGGDDTASFMVKPSVESSATLRKHVFDARTYSSGAFGPFLEVRYSGVTSGGGSVAQVAFYYRYSADGSSWGPWTLAGTDADGAPWQLNFNYPAGYGHYQFYSVATDNTANVEPAPVIADASVVYAETQAANVTLGNLTQTYNGSPRTVSVTTVPVGLAYTLTYDGAPGAPVNAGSYAVTATITEPGYIGSSSGTLQVDKATQTISFAPLAPKWITDAPFALTATASSGLPVGYASSVPAVASVSGSTVTLHKAGATNITASQPGDANYLPAANVDQPLSVNLLAQTIDFPAIASRSLSQSPFAPPASASSGLLVTISVVSGPATASGNTVTLMGTGTVVLRATQSGDATYAAATSVDQAFSVTNAGSGPTPVPAAPAWALALLAVFLMLVAGLALKRAASPRRD